MSEVVEANMSQTVSLQNFAEVLCYRVGIEDRSHSVNKNITVVVVAITVSADALIFPFLRQGTASAVQKSFRHPKQALQCVSDCSKPDQELPD